MRPEAANHKWTFPQEKATLQHAGKGNNKRENALDGKLRSRQF